MLVFKMFSFLQKEGLQTRKPCTWTQIKHFSVGSDDVDILLRRETGGPERLSVSLTCLEDVGSRMMITLRSGDSRPKI